MNCIGWLPLQNATRFESTDDQKIFDMPPVKMPNPKGHAERCWHDTQICPLQWCFMMKLSSYKKHSYGRHIMA
jgi:hypothetical protein